MARALRVDGESLEETLGMRSVIEMAYFSSGMRYYAYQAAAV